VPTTYLDPLERAWTRIRRILLRPFVIEKWIVVGFAAFLAGLAGHWSGLGFGERWRLSLRPDFDSWRLSPYRSFTDAFLGTSWFRYGVPLAFLFLILLVVVLWVSSRGKFIFLDNLVHDRPAIIAPWKRHRRLGNSLFFWRLGFALTLLSIFGLLVAPAFVLDRGLGHSSFGRPLGGLVALAAALVALVLGIVAAFVALFLESFVIPIMYQRNLTTMDAWRVFRPLLLRDPAAFVLYGVLILLAYVGSWLSVLALLVITCCIGPLLLSVPYLGSVLLLPLSGLYRLYSLEFLAEFGPDYALLPPLPAESSTEPT